MCQGVRTCAAWPAQSARQPGRSTHPCPLGRLARLRRGGFGRTDTVLQGASPEHAVLTPLLQSWTTPNLFVLGASSFPQNTVASPTLTILAQTLRTADALITRYLRRPSLLI